MKEKICENCKMFACTGYHSYHCFKDDDNPESAGPFDRACEEYEEE